MIAVSEVAKAAVSVALHNSGASPQQSLRIRPGMHGLEFEIDRPTGSDRVICHNGTPVIVIDKALDDASEGLQVDLVDGALGPEVLIRLIAGLDGGEASLASCHMGGRRDDYSE
ncbi:MAG: hypothetical protein ACE5Q6_18640 [Dehalococcoidia bacterium]